MQPGLKSSEIFAFVRYSNQTRVRRIRFRGASTKILQTPVSRTVRGTNFFQNVGSFIYPSVDSSMR